jgi:hypothetical protein
MLTKQILTQVTCAAVFFLAMIRDAPVSAADAEKDAAIARFRSLWAKYLDAEVRELDQVLKMESLRPLSPYTTGRARSDASKKKILEQQQVCREFVASEDQIKKENNYVLPQWLKDERAWRSLDEKCQH